MKRTTEVLEVNVQKGAPDGHKASTHQRSTPPTTAASSLPRQTTHPPSPACLQIVFHNKADEIPDGDAGDVVFVLKEKPHEMFTRHGADLYIKKEISLLEALTGFEMELPKLDGRTLVLKTKPGDVTKITTFDPLKAGEDGDDCSWEVLEGTDCDLDDMAQADSADVDMLKKAVSKGQLKGKGIGCFVVSGGRTTFKRGTRAECIAAKSSSSGSVMYVLEDESKAGADRMMRAVEGEGLPLMRDPYQFGNLFLQLDIVFPEEATTPSPPPPPPVAHTTTVQSHREKEDPREGRADKSVAADEPTVCQPQPIRGPQGPMLRAYSFIPRSLWYVQRWADY